MCKQGIFITVFLALASCNAKDSNRSKENKTIIKEGNNGISSYKPDDPIDFVLAIYAGDHSYAITIGSDSIKLNREFKRMSPDLSDTSSFNVHKHLLSQAAINYIWKYIQDNSTPSDGVLPHGEKFYYVGGISDSPWSKSGCRVDNKELGVKYFTGLVKWIGDSPYKKECKYLIGDIQGRFIADGPFHLTPLQEDILKYKKNKSQ